MTTRPVVIATLLATLAACTSQPDAGAPPADAADRQAPTTPPANVSHGEAPVGMVTDAAPFDPNLPARRTGRVVRVRFEMRDTLIQIAKGVMYRGWTFNGQVPGPVIRLAQGDSVDFTLVNRAPMPHSMDFHAAQIAPDKYYVNVMPNDSIRYQFVAEVPGAFMYHCGTAPVAAHIANGMYGALIVDPSTPRPAARELVFVQSEFYLTPDTSAAPKTLSWDRLLSLAPDYVTFNGHAAQYATHPISVKVDELLRLYVVNAGPNRTSSFHVVGGIFSKVFVDGSQTSPLSGVQTVAVPVGGGSIFEIRLKEAGEYPFVTHAFADATKGGVGVFKAER